MAWLGATVEQDEIQARVSRACEPAHWTLENEKIKAWLNGDRHNLLLWLNGSPGTGKSHVFIPFETPKPEQESVKSSP